MTNSIEEFENADVIFIIGSNTTETHPVIATFMKRAKNRGAKLIVADPRKIEMAQNADVYMQLESGTNVALINAMMNVIINEDLYDKDFIEERCENFEELFELIKDFTPEKAEEITKVPADLIREAARLYAKGPKSSIAYTMGIAQHSNGTDNVFSLSNLALLCGMVGKESTGVNPLRGQNNVQGSCDMGALPDGFPGYQKIDVKANVEKFEKAWGVPLSDRRGLTVSDMMEKAYNSELKCLYVMGENPMVSDPDLNHVKKALSNLDFLVVQDIFLTETAALADVVLPASSFAEKDGTFTNTERRVQLIRKAVPNQGNSKADLDIILELMDKFGYHNAARNAEEVMDEISKVVPQYKGINYKKIVELEGVQWPCPSEDHPGTKYLYKDGFAIGKAKFKAVNYNPPNETPDEEYPFVLNTGRVLYHYHTMTMTDKTEGLMKIASSGYVEMNPKSADKLGIVDGERVKLKSRRGETFAKVRILNSIAEGNLFVPFHFKDTLVNLLTNSAYDKMTKEPELKVCAVRLEKVINA